MPGIPVDKIEELWPIVSPHFEGTRRSTPIKVEELKQQCLDGKFILWVVRNGKATVILEVSDYHNGKECDIVMLAGDDMPTWIDELSEIEAWASRIGCNKMTLTGRQGWVKILKDYSIKEVIMVKSL